MLLPTGSSASQYPTPLSFPFANLAANLTDGPGDDDQGNGPGKEIQNWSSLIGIVTAIVGNILIALALNVQRYAHIRIHRRRTEVRDRARQALKNATNGREHGGIYGTTAPATNGSADESRHRVASRNGDGVEDAHESDPLSRSFESGDSQCSGEEDHKPSSTYLKDPYWWLGQVLITVGEMGNFLAYGFAPASIVSPLGVVALISNCVIAPILFKEVFRQRDFCGVVVAIAGAVTVVLSANQRETKLGPGDIWDAITTMEFEIYLGLSCGLIVLLMCASPKYGNRTILIDLGLVGLFGGYTALATKGVSSMLSSTLFGAFATPVTYALIFVLLSTAIMQVRYLNKALQRFDSTQVIPTQFVLFTLCVIIGSAVLYRDFERTTGSQAAKFIGGCLLTFFGVFLITTGRPRNDEEEDTLSDAEGVEETIGLAHHQATSQSPRRVHSSRRGSESENSRRLSRASHISFPEAVNKPLKSMADGDIHTPRIQGTAKSAASPMASHHEDGHEMPPSPLGNPWLDSDANQTIQRQQQQPRHPGIGPQTVSSDSVLTLDSALSEPPLVPSTPQSLQHQTHHHLFGAASAQVEQPITPRPSPRPLSSVRSGTVISPSPFASTVSAVVSDKLLPHDLASRKIAYRRSRPSLMSGLFVPQDERDDEGGDATATRPSRREGDDTSEQHSFPAEDPGKSFRGRARSLSNTLGELFGVRRKRDAAEGGEDDPLLTGAPTRPLASGSTETL